MHITSEKLPVITDDSEILTIINALIDELEKNKKEILSIPESVAEVIDTNKYE